MPNEKAIQGCRNHRFFFNVRMHFYAFRRMDWRGLYYKNLIRKHPINHLLSSKLTEGAFLLQNFCGNRFWYCNGFVLASLRPLSHQ